MTQPMTFLDAAERVLSESGAGGPLHTRDIARIALERKYIVTQGKTPEATMAAQLYMAVKDDADEKRAPRFIQVGKGLFALAGKSSRRGLEAELESANKHTRDALLSRLSEMTPKGFEHLIARLLAAVGYEDVAVTGRSGDGGIDAVGRLSAGGISDVPTAIQAKRWKSNVPGKVVREMRGSLKVDQRGLIVTTAGYTKEAIEESKAAGKQPISLVDGEKLVGLLIKHDIGVIKKSVQVLELNLEAFTVVEDEAAAEVVSGRMVSVWPLPGGATSYYETLLEFLKHISVARPDDSQMVQWIKTQYPNVSKDGVAGGYIRLLRTFGLVSYDGETLVLTEEGLDFLSAPTKARLLAILRARVLGIDEILQMLEERPLRKEEVNERLAKELGRSWETDTQTSFRLKWLEVLEALKLVEGKYILQ